MSSPVIKIENLAKSYRIGHQAQRRHNTMRDVLAERARQWARKIRYPFDSSLFGGSDTVEEFWALQDVSLEIRQGDRIGIVGRNGAGKSTLLKILSRITEPTRGRIEIEGRVASLLEVGTGFHSELTGRENIFLNGAILGMTRQEIRKKFDEIVAFAEVEQFLDTPVKRYSSGMYVRLAFAVAAHLEPEILIVDEVLAVGDAAFQKKCLGKMAEVGREGRTVLFVSHNMAAVQNLCNRAVLLESGKVNKIGSVEEVSRSYFSAIKTNLDFGENLLTSPRPKSCTGDVLFSKCRILNSEGNPVTSLRYGEPVSLSLNMLSKRKHKSLNLYVGIQTQAGIRVCTVSSGEEGMTMAVDTGDDLEANLRFPSLVLVPGYYQLFLSIRSEGKIHDELTEVRFQVSDEPYNGRPFHPGSTGLISIQADWSH